MICTYLVYRRVFTVRARTIFKTCRIAHQRGLFLPYTRDTRYQYFLPTVYLHFFFTAHVCYCFAIPGVYRANHLFALTLLYVCIQTGTGNGTIGYSYS